MEKGAILWSGECNETSISRKSEGNNESRCIRDCAGHDAQATRLKYHGVCFPPSCITKRSSMEKKGSPWRIFHDELGGVKGPGTLYRMVCTLYKRIPIELALPMSYPFFFHAVKLRNIDAWNPTYGETLRRNWKKILKITNACSANVLTLCILWNMNFEWNLENNFFVIRKKKKSREVENLSRYWNGFFRKYTRFIGIPAIFLVF